MVARRVDGCRNCYGFRYSTWYLVASCPGGRGGGGTRCVLCQNGFAAKNQRCPVHFRRVISFVYSFAVSALSALKRKGRPRLINETSDIGFGLGQTNLAMATWSSGILGNSCVLKSLSWFNFSIIRYMLEKLNTYLNFVFIRQSQQSKSLERF